MSVLPKIREKLNEEIKVALVMTAAYPDGDFFKGRLMACCGCATISCTI